MNGPDTIKQAWRAIGGDPALPDLDAARAGADRFYRAVRRRNTIEYAACAVVVICFSAIAASFPLFIVRIGAVMVVIGTLVVARQLHRFASASQPAGWAAAEPVLLYQRAQLSRQRDALAGIFTWYLLPLIPGLLVVILGPSLDHGVEGLPHALHKVWIVLIVAIATFTGIWLLNRRGAARLQKMIDDIDALVGEKE